MSHDIDIIDPATGQPRELPEPLMLRGATYAIGGTPYAEMNVTYNYSRHYLDLWGHGLDQFDGRTVATVYPLVQQVVDALGTERSDDYWESTPGNAGAAMADLLQLLELCEETDTIRVL